MDVKHHIKLLLTKIYCVQESAESGADEIYFWVYEDGVKKEYYRKNPIKMNTDWDRDVSLEIDATYLSSLKVVVREKDYKGNSDDTMGETTFTRSDPMTGMKEIIQTTGKKQAHYQLSYRVIDHPIPTLRVHGVQCIQQHANCNEAAVEAMVAATEKIVEKTGKIMVRTPAPPQMKAIGEAFVAGAKIIGEFGADIVTWCAKIFEGKDDVYMQIRTAGSDGSGGGFMPNPDGSQGRTCHMKKDEEVYFQTGQFKAGTNAEYYRFPLDTGSVTVQLREHDSWKPDIRMGAITIDKQMYDQMTAQGDGVCIRIADEYFRYTEAGQGALYQIAYSVGLENWAADANHAAQNEH